MQFVCDARAASNQHVESNETKMIQVTRIPIKTGQCVAFRRSEIYDPNLFKVYPTFFSNETAKTTEIMVKNKLPGKMIIKKNDIMAKCLILTMEPIEDAVDTV